MNKFRKISTNSIKIKKFTLSDYSSLHIFHFYRELNITYNM